MLLSRQKQVPLLVADGQVTVGSAAIIEHVERTHPDPPLFPREPSERQRALELARFFDEELGPYLRRALFYELLPTRAICTRSSRTAPARDAHAVSRELSARPRRHEARHGHLRGQRRRRRREGRSSRSRVWTISSSRRATSWAMRSASPDLTGRGAHQPHRASRRSSRTRFPSPTPGLTRLRKRLGH
jgi:hypothetical protein